MVMTVGYKIGGTVALTTNLDKSAAKAVAKSFVNIARMLLKPDGNYKDEFTDMFCELSEKIAYEYSSELCRSAVLSLKAEYQDGDSCICYTIFMVKNNDREVLFEIV